MQFRLLGPVEVTEGERPLPLGGPKQRAVLAHLLLRANQVVSTDALIEQVWGDEPPEAAKNSLQSYVSHLRKALGPNRVEGRTPGYVLRVEIDEVDALKFEALLREARSAISSEPELSASLLEDALHLWRGSPIADLAEEPSLQGEIARLEELRLSALEDRVEALLALGRHEEAVPELETVVAAQPLRERLWGHLMLALYRSGRQAEALSAYQRARQVLADELGIDPSPELQHLHEQILRQDPALEPGVRPLRGYRLLERVGEGAFGVVWRATQPQVGREVAVKAIHAHLANRSEFIRSFESEAQLIARLEHPHIVPLYDYWREPDGAYLVMRYLRGGSLKRALADGPIDHEWASRIVDQVARALAAAHRQGVVHRDVKPSNILLDEEGGAYLSDFGIAAELTSRTDQGPQLPYRSPEIARGEPSGPASDTYSLAAVAFEALTGRRPSAGPLSARAVRPDLTVALDEVLARATAQEPHARYADPGEFAEALVRALRVPAEVEPRREVETLNPYKGLRPFTEADASDFFGRERLIAQVLARLSEGGEGSRFLALVGPSGSGKSSVVHAGVVPALREGALRGSADWFVVDMTPGKDPFVELEVALRKVAVDPPARLLEKLERDETGVLRVVDRILPEERSDLLLVVDQFEEVFTLVENEERRLLFLSSLATAAEAPRSRLRVLLTLRGDFYDRPLAYPGFGDLLAARTLAVPPLSPEELERAVAGPAERAGVGSEPALTAEVVAEVSGHPGALPLMQYALTELFEGRRNSTLTLSAYRQIGGVSGALARRAEQLYGALNDLGRQAVRQLFLRLVTMGEGTEDTRRRVPRSELTSLEVDRTAMEGVIDTFGRHRLLSFDRDAESREPTVEVAHEALLTSWERLRGWIDQAREDVRTERRLGRAAAEWEESSQDPSFLLRGARLDAFESWAGSTDIALSPAEREHLDASVAERRRVEAEEQARRTREQALERRSLARLRALVAVLTATAVIATGLTVFAFNQRGVARRVAIRAEEQARLATARELATAADANLEVDPELSILLAIEAVRTTRSFDGTVLREAEEVLHRAVIADRLELEVEDGVGGWLAWSSAGVFVTEGPESSGLIDIRDADTGKRVLSFRGHDGDVNQVAFSPDGSKLATTGDDGELKVWEPSTGRLLSSLSGSGSAFGPSFSADGSLVASAWDARGDVRVLDLSTNRVISDVRVDDAYGTALSPDGKHVAAASVAGRGAVFDVESGEKAFRLSGGDSRAVSWSPDGRYVAASSDDSIRVWEAAGGRLRHTLRHGGRVWSVAWSPDSSRLVTGAEDGLVKVWEIGVRSVRELWTLSAGGTGGVSGVAFSPDGSRVMAGDLGVSSVTIWDVGPNGDAEWANLPAPGWPVAEFTPDGRRVVTGTLQSLGPRGEPRAVTIWDLQGRELRTIGPAADYFWFGSFDVSPDGASIALGGGSRLPFGGASATRAWDTSTGEELFRFGHELDVNEVSFSPDGEHLATASWDGTAKIVDRTGRVIRVLGKRHGTDPDEGDFSFSNVAFSPDGRLVATAAFPSREEVLGGRVTIWDWERGEAVRTISNIAAWSTVDFDSTGSRIVTAGSSVVIWDVKSGSRVGALAGQSGGVNGAAFSPDGSRVATAGEDGTVRLFDAATGAQQLVLHGSGCAVQGIAFSPDGRKLASTSWCDGVRIWALDIDDLLEIAHQEAGRSLTDEECRQYLHVQRCPSG